jgi:hypothetical protein
LNKLYKGQFRNSKTGMFMERKKVLKIKLFQGLYPKFDLEMKVQVTSQD